MFMNTLRTGVRYIRTLKSS